MFADSAEEPAERRVRGNRTEEALSGSQLVGIADLLATGGEHQGQICDHLPGPVNGRSRNELREPVFAELAETQRVEQVAQGGKSRVGDQGLVRCHGWYAGVKAGIVVH